MIKWKGVFPAITTKFTSDDQLDLNAFHANIRVQMKAGVDGVIIGGSLGEASTLSSREKEMLVKSTVE
ncbi:MAG: dihydrodipicolinate synthase family protein, partial [Cyclobacteriaceae bacterium]